MFFSRNKEKLLLCFNDVFTTSCAIYISFTSSMPKNIARFFYFSYVQTFQTNIMFPLFILFYVKYKWFMICSIIRTCFFSFILNQVWKFLNFLYFIAVSHLQWSIKWSFLSVHIQSEFLERILPQMTRLSWGIQWNLYRN